jgi:GT2 family glycosyltransferase
VNLENVVIVDNNSSDETLSIASRYKNRGPVRIIESKTNLGFARACNLGARECGSDYILFLNPDARLLADSIRIPVIGLDQPSMTDVAVCGVQLLDRSGRPTHSVARFPTIGSFISKALGLSIVFPQIFPASLLPPGSPASSGYVDQIIGAFFLIRRTAFAELGGFDERYFLYYEELDLSLRLQEAGWKSYFFKDAQAVHHGRGSSDQVKARRLFLSLESRLLYCFKNFGAMAALGVLAVTLFVEPISRLLWLGIRFNGRGCADVLRAYSTLFARLPLILKKSALGIGY